MTRYYVEIRPGTQRSGPPRLVPLEEVDQHTGFRSIVCYDEEVAKLIRSQGSMKGLRGQPVYADTLFMDFDGHDPVTFRQFLAGSGLAYTEWRTGGRSVHFHIPLEPIYGTWVTAAMKQWTREHAPTADISFLHNAGQYRLPGTIHWKNPGHYKHQVDARDGEKLVLEHTPEVDRVMTVEGSGDAKGFYELLTKGVGEGQRRPRAWLLGTLAAEAGLTFEKAVAGVLWWNQQWNHPPVDPDQIEQQVEKAYRRVLG